MQEQEVITLLKDKLNFSEKSIKKLQHIDHHCREYGALEGKLNEKPKKKVLKIPQNLRPIWLFPKPKRLNRFNHQLYHNQKISLISGPERIESSWWEENETQRDYYIAEEDCGVRLWAVSYTHLTLPTNREV